MTACTSNTSVSVIQLKLALRTSEEAVCVCSVSIRGLHVVLTMAYHFFPRQKGLFVMMMLCQTVGMSSRCSLDQLAGLWVRR